jgi:hypothetical protein
VSDLYRCVVCGRSYIGGNHKCPDKTLKRQDAEAKREPPLPQEPTTETNRLELGFFILSLGELV